MSCVARLFPIHSSSSSLCVCMHACVRARVCVCACACACEHALFACQPFFCNSTGADEYEVDQWSFQGPPLCMYAHGWSIMYRRLNWFPAFICGTLQSVPSTDVNSVSPRWSKHTYVLNTDWVMRGSRAVWVLFKCLSKEIDYGFTTW